MTRVCRVMPMKVRVLINIQGRPKKAQCLHILITLLNINRFSNFFTVGISGKFIVTLLLKIPSNLVCVATLPCEMSDIAFKPATTLAYCMINVDQAWPLSSKQPELKSGRLCCLGAPSTNGLSTSTIHSNQPADAGDHH